MRKIIKFILTEFLYNGHLQSLSSACLVAISTYLVLQKAPTWDIFVASYLLFQTIFLFDRFKDLKKDKQTNPERTAHLTSYVSIIPLILIGMVVSLTAIIFAYSDIVTLILSLVIAILGILYPIYFKGLTKKIFMFKNWYVSIFYGFMVFYPVFYYKLPINSLSLLGLIIFPIFVFLESFVSQIILDTKDVDSDKKHKLKTLAAVYGKRKAILLAFLIGIIMNVIKLICYFVFNMDFVFLIIIIGSTIANLFMIYAIIHKSKSGYFIAAGKYLAWFLPYIFVRMYV